MNHPVSPRMGQAMPFRTPRDVCGCTVWLSALVGVLAGTVVTTWQDLTYRGNNATVGGGSPAYGVVAARPAITTSATDWLSITATVDTDFDATKGGAGYAVFDSVSASLDAVVWAKYDTVVAAQRNWIVSVNDGATTTSGEYISETGTNTLRRVTQGDASTGAIRTQVVRFDPTGNVRGSLDANASTATAIAGIKATTGTVTIGRLDPLGTVTIAANVRELAFFRCYPPFNGAEDVFLRSFFRQRNGAA